MEKVGNHKSFSKIFFSLALLLSFSLSVFSQDTVAVEAAASSGADAVKGKELFNANCAACHKLDAKATGPALRGVADKYEKQWLYKWIKNSADLIKSGDALAIKVFEENGKVPMSAFPQLSDADIDNMLAYTSEVVAVPTPSPGSVPGKESSSASSDSGISNNIILGALSLVLIMLIVMLFLVRNVLTKIASSNGIESTSKEKSVSIWQAYVKNQFLILVTVIILLLVSAYFAYGYLMQIGVDQDYEPVQPIHYSHKIHAGDNGIDCNYCHSAARVGKHSNIPSLNVCMNCHINIGEVAESTATEEYSKEFYDGEIQKLYDAVGWDKESQKYTGNSTPVKWVRIHNLPDFVYFNHSQHVTVGGIECQTCHGPVEEMEIMKQHSPLTMGWCINCHRETNVKVEDNEYYKKVHEELSKKYGVKSLTVAQMGGLECGKCHY